MVSLYFVCPFSLIAKTSRELGVAADVGMPTATPLATLTALVSAIPIVPVSRALFMRRVQPAIDTIDTQIEVLRKEVADLKGCRERFLSNINESSRFGDQPLISGLR